MSWYPIEHKSFAVLGLGKTGQATIAWLKAQGASHIYAWDDKSQDTFGAMRTQTPPWSEIVALIQSPGIAPTHPLSQAALQAGVPIITDCDLFRAHYPDLPAIGITGTNGKSTTTALIHHMLNENGQGALLGGNIGQPVLTLEPQENTRWVVIELSSYQLELSQPLNLTYAVWLNLKPDHLERHKSFDNYGQAKERIFSQLQKKAIVAIDDLYSADLAARLNPVTVSVTGSADFYVQKGLLMKGAQALADFREIPFLKGPHNHQNMAAAYALGEAIGLSHEGIVQSFRTFPGLAHRQQWVTCIKDVTFINDSKGTNADATSHALAAYDQIYWILGGMAKQEGIQGLEVYFPKVKKAFLIGEAADRFASDLSGYVPFEKCGTMERAVARAFDCAEKSGGGVVLLSPACASWDQYKDFEARGDDFCRVVKALGEMNDAA